MAIWKLLPKARVEDKHRKKHWSKKTWFPVLWIYNNQASLVVWKPQKEERIGKIKTGYVKFKHKNSAISWTKYFLSPILWYVLSIKGVQWCVFVSHRERERERERETYNILHWLDNTKWGWRLWAIAYGLHNNSTVSSLCNVRKSGNKTEEWITQSMEYCN